MGFSLVRRHGSAAPPGPAGTPGAPAGSTSTTARGGRSFDRNPRLRADEHVRSSGVSLRLVSLRGTPIIEHASLPGGGSVTIWVGVPDDPYIDDKRELRTVDVQLHEGRAVLASLSTVLGPEQSSEGLQLAREIKSALEAGEIGLHAHELEPFADRLR